MPPTVADPQGYRCSGCSWVFGKFANLLRHWHQQGSKNPPSVCAQRRYFTIYATTRRASGTGALSLLLPSVVAGGGAGPAGVDAGAGPAKPAMNYASALLDSVQTAATHAPPSSGAAAQQDVWDVMDTAQDMQAIDDMEQDNPDPPTANGLANWPTKERLRAINLYRPTFRLKDGGGGSEEIPLRDLPEEIRSQRQASKQHARTACLGEDSLAMQAYALEPDARAKLGLNWADKYDEEVRRNVDALQRQKTASFLMAAGFMANWLPSQAGQDAFLRLMSANSFNCKDVQCETFAQMQRAILKSMPDMLRSKEWHVTILGKGGQLVKLFYADKSPVTLWYHNAWEVGLRLYADPANKGKSTLRPTPAFTEDGQRSFCSLADGTSPPPSVTH